ncbi:4-hydroxythreonine-4-phosphate dehydrogenase PdxA [Treponema sp. OMZ 840]|uniref:4-hydroxythreonine-4-phosphate dehydrogenase PdxA n=1 Tax=Treponema sp. OMZ 840 TaxID=244313 RepID=UPI003D92CFAC
MKKPVLGMLMGDPAGVGPEIIAKLIVNGFIKEYCNPVVIGERRVLERAFDVIGSKVPIVSVRDAESIDFNSNAIQLFDIDDPNAELCEFGKVSLAGGKTCLTELNIAVELCKTEKIEGFCFAPLNKASMKVAGMHFESEHHYLADLFHLTGPFCEINVVGSVWTTRTTSHIPIKDVSQNLSVERILRAVSLCSSTLKNSGIASPRIAVAALNPHCGENGLCGREEIDIIEPAIKKANEQGIAAFGPYSSDILFIKAFQGEFDGVVTMYHDQGQIALKLKGFDEGITIGGGQPYPIVTCGHGTAYDIAGKNLVKTHSFENAVKMAARMANHIAGRN